MPDPGRARVGILISGRGSNMAALLTAMSEGRVAADPAVVVSNVEDAQGLATAQASGIATAHVDHRGYARREDHERRMIEILREHRADVVCLAGFMRRLSPLFVAAFPGRILNIHPSLLPAFAGRNAQRDALEYGVKVAGCTVHLVDDQVDHGPIVLQAEVPVLDDDTVATLSARILEREHEVYPKALALVVAGKISVDGRRVRVKG